MSLNVYEPVRLAIGSKLRDQEIRSSQVRAEWGTIYFVELTFFHSRSFVLIYIHLDYHQFEGKAWKKVNNNIESLTSSQYLCESKNQTWRSQSAFKVL